MKSKFVFLAAGLLLIAICGVGVSQTNPGRTAGGYPWLVGAIDSGGNAIKATLASHGVWIGNGTAPVVKTLPDCVDTGGQHLNFTQSTDVFSCGTSGGGGATGFKLESMQFPNVTFPTFNGTSTETTLAIYTLAANELGNLQQLVTSTDGWWNTDNNAANLTLRFKVGGATVFTVVQGAYAAPTGNRPWSLTVKCMAQASPGASVNVDCQGFAMFGFTSAGTGALGGNGNTSAFSVATNGTLAITVTAQWVSSTTTASSITSTQFSSFRYN